MHSERWQVSKPAVPDKQTTHPSARARCRRRGGRPGPSHGRHRASRAAGPPAQREKRPGRSSRTGSAWGRRRRNCRPGSGSAPRRSRRGSETRHPPTRQRIVSERKSCVVVWADLTSSKYTGPGASRVACTSTAASSYEHSSHARTAVPQAQPPRKGTTATR
eukprot:SAG22_NODE_490_length_9834_cov_7.723780_3_plen_162_part_00